MPRRHISMQILVCALLALASLPASATASLQGTPAGSPAAIEGAAPAITREAYAQRLVAELSLESPGRRGGDLLVGTTDDIASAFNPVIEPTVPLLGLVFESLVGISLLDGQPVPGLADSWEIAPDGVTYTFHLNERATWHDGTDVTAEDVAFSYDAILNPATNTPVTSGIATEIAGYRAVDADTFELRSSGMRANFLVYIAGFVPVVARHVWDAVAPGAWAADPGNTGDDPARVVGTGPFRFDSWARGDHARFVRHDAYYDVVPVIDSLTFQVFPDRATAVTVLRTGGVDVVEDVAGGQASVVQGTGGLTLATYDTANFLYLGYNLDPAKTTLFQQREVRQALVLALDRQAVNDTIFQGLGEVAVGTQSLLSVAYAPDRIRTRYPYDPARAEELLTQAGWVDADGDGVRERNGQPLAFNLIYPAEFETAGQQVVAYLQEAWAAVGVEMTPEARPFPDIEARLSGSHDFDVVFLGFGWDVSGDQGALFNCAEYDGGFNAMRYCNPRYDELDERQRRELDPAKRRELQIELANIVNDDLPIVIIRFIEGSSGFADHVRNFRPNGYAIWGTLSYVWIDA